MNQHVPPVSIAKGTTDARTGGATKPPAHAHHAVLLRLLRDLCARAGCHYGLVHRLGPADQPLIRATLLHNLRGLEDSGLTLADLLNAQTVTSLRTGLPSALWSLDQAAGAPTPARRFLSRLHVGAGLSIPFHNALGSQVVVTLCDSAVRPGAEADASLLADARALALGLMAKEIAAQNAPELSTRERDCLQWAAGGKTAQETGLILHLSQHTVSQHLATAMVKLGAVNRVQTVAKAIRLGLIDLTQI